MRAFLVMASLVLCGVCPMTARAEEPPPDQKKPKKLALELTTIELMHEKHIISDAEYQTALEQMGDSIGGKAADSMTLMLSKWSATLYGFVQVDFIGDTTQSFGEQASNTLVAKPGTYAGEHGRFTAGVSNSRIGFLIKAPEFHKVRTTAMLEMDFLGPQATTASENAVFTSPLFRIRHMNMRIETPILDILIGQYWHLFGWQNLYHVNSAEIQGVPGQLYSRTIQLRLMKTVKVKSFTFEAAAALLRGPQRDAATPEGEGGVRFAYEDWTAVQTLGQVGTRVSALSLAVTADVRGFKLPEFLAKPMNSVDKIGWAVAVDAFVPILRGTKEKKSNSLSLQGEYVYGLGTADLYSQLNGGVTTVAPALPNPTMASPAPTFLVDVDPGLIALNADNTAHLIKWQSAIVGLQYYFPRLGDKLFISVNYSHLWSDNTQLHTAPANARSSLDWTDVNLFGQPVPSVRLGLEYAWFADHYADGVDAINHRVQFSAFYIY